MPLFSSQLQLNTAASASGTPLADIAAIKGAFKVYETYDGLTQVPVSLVSNKQIVWVEEAASLYQATVTLADYISSFTDSVSWVEFSFTANAGSGDITAVIAGAGLIGGAFSGAATLNIGAGDGISVSANAVGVSTGSLHFTDGVEKVVVVTELDGGEI